jgi:hypothetical protein
MKKLILIAIGITCLNGCAHHIVKKTDDKAVANKAVLVVGKTFSGIVW